MNEFTTPKQVTAVKSNVKKEEFDRYVFGKLGCNRRYDVTPAGNPVHTYYGLTEYSDFTRFFNNAPFIHLSAGSPFAAEYLCERFLCSVTWDEEAIQVIFYQDRQQLMETVRRSQQYILDQSECLDNLPTGILLAYSSELFHK